MQYSLSPIGVVFTYVYSGSETVISGIVRLLGGVDASLLLESVMISSVTSQGLLVDFRIVGTGKG